VTEPVVTYSCIACFLAGWCANAVLLVIGLAPFVLVTWWANRKEARRGR
jgi:hypothetical protein